MAEHDVFAALGGDDPIVGLTGGDLPVYEVDEDGQARLPGPELRLVRERWGLTPAWLHAQTGTAERTFQRWEVSNALIQARPGAFTSTGQRCAGPSLTSAPPITSAICKRAAYSDHAGRVRRMDARPSHNLTPEQETDQ